MIDSFTISDEKFMKPMNFLEDLKIRLGYGEVGNVNSIRHDACISLFF